MIDLQHRGDRGMTLPEVLIAFMLMGLLSAVLAAAISVTVRQSSSTEGRANIARAESSVDTWLPADLASTDVNNVSLPAVDLNPAATPCGNCAGIDMSGSNALQLAWESAGRVTRVQYQYVDVRGEWQLRRISCIGSEQCTVTVVLHDLDGPGESLTYDPKAISPVWILDVAVPAITAGLDLNDNARQIVVKINGGGTASGAAGGENTISLTAGGRTTEEIAADDFTVPSFVRAKSRCGGPVTLIVDDSGSIGSNVDTVVEPGVEAFIEAFRGTPTQLQIVRFERQAAVLGPGTDWHRYIDMTDDTQVDLLKAAVDGPGTNGNTNWEDAFFRALKNEDGTPASILPNRIVFFTDGIPTVNRNTGWGGWWDDFSEGAKNVDFNDGLYDRNSWPNENGSAFHQESFDRADVILDDHRNIDMIFVGVGSGLQNDVAWIQNPATYLNQNAAPLAATTKQGSDVLAHLLMNAPSGQVPAVFADGEYTNPETADFYLQESFDSDAFAKAMRAAALKDCGGTLTVQTRLSDGSPVEDEFVFENSSYRDESGDPVVAEARRVTTSNNFRTGTFDFEISGGSDYFSVDIVPSELQTLGDYTAVGWSCRAGATPKTLTSIPISDSSFDGFTVDVYANEAVSCILEVTQ